MKVLVEGQPNSPVVLCAQGHGPVCRIRGDWGFQEGPGGRGGAFRVVPWAGSRVAPESKWARKQRLRVLMKSLWGSGWGWGAGLPGRGVGVGSPHQPREKVGPEKPWGGGGCARVCWDGPSMYLVLSLRLSRRGFPTPWQGWHPAWHPPSLSYFSQGLDSALGHLCPPHCPRPSQHLQGARGVSGWSAQGVVFGDQSSAAGAGLAVSRALGRGL